MLASGQEPVRSDCLAPTHQGAFGEYGDQRPSTSMAASTSSSGAPMTFGNYMEIKKQKLLQQINVDDRPAPLSEIFAGISIFVNGYTEPPASELRRLITENGGEYHAYYSYGITTCTIASNLASSKALKLRKDERIVSAQWITKSIAAGRLLPMKEFILYENGERPGSKSLHSYFPGSTETETIEDLKETECEHEPSAFDARLDKLVDNKEVKAPLSSNRIPNATDPNFIADYYQRSRLHLISTLAQEMKQWVQEFRSSTDQHDYPARRRLLHLTVDEKKWSSEWENAVMHIDLDCFFVAVALRTRPELRGQPVVITHSRNNTDSGNNNNNTSKGFSEVASCSYEARAMGIRNGTLLKNALVKCPDLICLPYQFDDYRETSMVIYGILSEYTDALRAVSCDEMYVDLAPLCREMQIVDIDALVTVLRGHILERTQCNASAGIGPNMLLARLATRHAKPNGQKWIRLAEIGNFIRKEKIENLPGFGWNMMEKLKTELGQRIQLCEHLQMIPLVKLQALFGQKQGQQMYNLARGIDSRIVVEQTERKSVSCDINYGIRFTKESEVRDFINTVAAELQRKLEKAQVYARTITVKLMTRASDAPLEPPKFGGHGLCDTASRSATLENPTDRAAILVIETMRIFRQMAPKIADLRGIGVQLTRLERAKPASLVTTKTLSDFFAVKRRPAYTRAVSLDEKMPQHGIRVKDDRENWSAGVNASEENLTMARRELLPKPKKRIIDLTVRRKAKALEKLRKSRRSVIPAEVLQKPKFRDLNDQRELLDEIQKMTENEAIQADVQDLSEYAQQLMCYRDFRTASIVLRMLHRAAFESPHLSWQTAAIAIARELERQCREKNNGKGLPNSILVLEQMEWEEMVSAKRDDADSSFDES